MALDECKTPEVNKESTIRIVRVKTPDSESICQNKLTRILDFK